MASVSNDPNGRKRIQFTDDDGKRHAIRLGKVSQANAAIAQRNIETLSIAKIGNQPLPKTTTEWLNAIPRKLRERLEKIGLVSSVKRLTLYEFLDEAIEKWGNLKPPSRHVYGQSVRMLKEFFPADKLLSSVSEGDACKFREWLIGRKDLAASTKKKRLAMAKAFFESALKHRHIERNPFDIVKPIPDSNVKARQYFVERETAYKLMDIAPPSYRLMIALCRFQGLRAPSEVCSLKWGMIDFERGEMTISSPKTEHHPGGSSRKMPLSLEMKNILLDALNREGEGDGFIVGREFYDLAMASSNKYGWAIVGLNTRLRSLVKKAGMHPWPRLWHNMRSSLETELMRGYPIALVASWLGHNQVVALKHYNQTSREANLLEYERFNSGAHLQPDEKSGAKSGASNTPAIPAAAQKASHRLSATNSTESQPATVRADRVVTYAESCDSLPNGTGVHSGQSLNQE